jgi:hypothetical protein
MDSRNLYLYWTGKEYNLIKILREFIYLHSNHGKGYNVHLITEENIRDYIDSLPEYFYQLCPAHQADFIRVHVICQHGGIWLDSDTLVMDTLDTLFDKLDYGNGFFIRENNSILWNGVFGSRRETPLMIEWKNRLVFQLNKKHENITWCEVGNDMLQTIYQQQPCLYQEYEILNGLDTVYPVNWCNCVNEYLEKPYENYQNLIRPYQPIIVLVNSVYKALESKSVDEIRNGMLPLNYFMNKSHESIYRSVYNGSSIKKYVLITPWIKDFITLEPYTFAKNLSYFGWELIETDQKVIPSEKCILLCITYDDIDISIYKRDHIFLIYKIDDLIPYKPIRNTCIHSSDLLIGPYQYLWNTKEIENIYGNISTPQFHLPYSAVNDFYQSCGFNSEPILKIFISGNDNQAIYPFRYYMNHNKQLSQYTDRLSHPEYTSYKHNTINKNYYDALNRYLCCFTDASNYKYVLLKVFEICSVGSLLLVDDSIQDELSKLGFYDQVNCVLCNPSNVQQKIEYILNRDNRRHIDHIRMMGMNLVRERHHTFHRSFVFNSKIENTVFTIMDKIGMSNKETFEHIYKHKIWNNQDDRIPLSGPGSSIENAKECSKWIHQFIQEHSCVSFLDLGCGDLTWMSHSPFFKENTIEYTGIDVVEPLIQSHTKRFTDKTFFCEDITKYVPQKKYSIILIRDVLFHLKNNEILSIFENIKDKFDYIIITCCKNKINQDLFDRWKFSEKNILIEPFHKTQYELRLEEPQFNRSLYLYRHNSFYN